MKPREQIFAALFQTLQQNIVLPTPYTAWGLQGRRWQIWDDMTPEQQPTLFQMQGKQDADSKAFGATRWRMRALIWIYFRTDDSASQNFPPSTTVNAFIDAVDAALQSKPPGGKQTLGGLVEHCWIEGTVHIDEGVSGDGQAVIVIPVEILTGT